MLSQAVEDYIKAIYVLQHEGAPVPTSEIARHQEVSAASVTNMVKRLAVLGLAEHESYRGVTLTAAGERVALEIIRHHRLLELYLREVMGYSWAELHEEAEHLEHHISEAFEEKLEELLDYPTHDPHGDPIPARDGTIGEIATTPLADVPAGRTVTVGRVSDADPELLHHLEDLGLLPGAQVAIVERAPFDGPLTLRVDGREQLVGPTVASSVFVGS